MKGRPRYGGATPLHFLFEYFCHIPAQVWCFYALSIMPKKYLPRFVIYQPNKKEFHFCLEVKGKFLRWCSYYPPTLDVRFAREMTRIKDMPVKSLKIKKVFDEGTYATTKADTKDAVEQKAAEELENKSFAFTLNGKQLKGRFILKHNQGSTVLQKYKDKFAKEEDVLSGDLSRTISTMIPDYDEKKIVLNTPPPKEPEPEIPEDLTADTTISNTEYHFAYYSSDDEPDICLVTSAKSEVIVLKSEGDEWVLLQPIKGATLKKEKQFTDYAKALFDSLND